MMMLVQFIVLNQFRFQLCLRSLIKYYYYIIKRESPTKLQQLQMNQNHKQNDPVLEKSIIPVTITQIHEFLKDDVSFEGQNYETISIIGRLEDYSRKQKFALLQFSDGTGVVEGRLSILDGKMSSFAQNIPFTEMYGQYFFVVLKPRFSEEGRKFNIVGIKVVTDYNTVTKHFTDVILSFLMRNKK